MSRRNHGRAQANNRKKEKTDPRLSSYDKIYVLDTNVLVHDPNAIEKFRDNIIVIPICVIEEMDRLKTDNRLGEVARNARVVSQKLRGYKNNQGSLTKGIKTATGGLLFTDHNGNDFGKLPAGMERNNDNRIILVAIAQQEKHPNHKVAIVTKDANLDLAADSCGVAAEDYESDHVLEKIDELYSGYHEFLLPEGYQHLLTDLHVRKQLPVKETPFAETCEHLHPNTCCRFSVPNGDKSGLAILKKQAGFPLFQVIDRKKMPSKNSIKPKNDEQCLFSGLLNDADLSLITCAGKAGTGKTLLALLNCYVQIDGYYERLVIYRPLSEVGRGIGFLPGDMAEKFAHYTLPIFDNFGLIFGDSVGSDDPKVGKGKSKLLDDMIEKGIIEIAPFTFIRGRSLNRCLILVDEAQNMTPHEAKTLITRVGFNSKIVLVGDPYQIDNPHLDSLSNGLSYVIERFKDKSISGHITLTRGERSPLAELAADIL